MSWFSDHAVLFALICAGAAVAYGLGLTRWILAQPAGTERMQEISRAVQEGAAAYLRRQYITIAGVAIVPFLLLGFYNKLGWGTAVGFLIGAVLSSAAGFIGMNVAVRSNVRTAEAARSGLSPALNVAFRAGSVTGLLVVGLGLLGVAGYYWALTDWLGHTPNSAIKDLLGLAFGGSLISVFARLGGGIFTKAADVGADLVGKLEAGIPEDDPRNPAVIADNVGDNVGDCAGMAADLFETYAVTAVAVMLLGITGGAATTGTHLWLFPLAIGGLSILTSIIGSLFARVREGGNVMNALYRSVLVATVLSALGFIPITMGFDTSGRFSFWHLYVAALVGLVVTFLLVGITEYYTGTRWNPVKAIAKASETGHATNIIEGLAIGMQATALPVIVIAAGILDRESRRRPLRHRRRRHGAALDDRPDRRARRVRAGHRQRRRHRRDGRPPAGGARDHRSARRGRQHDEGRHEGLRDRLGRARRARPLRLVRRRDPHAGRRARQPRHADVRSLERLGDRRPAHRRPDAVPVRVARDAGGRPRRRRGRAGGAPPVPREPRDHGGDVASRVRARDRHRHEVRAPQHAAARARADRRSRSSSGSSTRGCSAACSIGTIVTGLFLAIAMTAGGGAWDNAKKSIEDGAHGGKGSEAHNASITGDTVGDPYKDTAGPAINPMIKIANIVAILIIPLIISIHG